MGGARQFRSEGSRLSEKLPASVRMGIGWGVAMATLYSCWVTILRIVGGSGSFDAIGTSWLATVGSYYLGGILGGGLVGSLWILRRWALGAFALGTVAVMPVFLIILSTKSDLGVTQCVLLSLIPSSVVGGVNGYFWWRSDIKTRRDEG